MQVRHALHAAPRVGPPLAAAQPSAASKGALLARRHRCHRRRPAEALADACAERSLPRVLTSAAGGGAHTHTRPHRHRWQGSKLREGSDNRREKGARGRDIRKPFARAGLLKRRPTSKHTLVPVHTRRGTRFGWQGRGKSPSPVTQAPRRTDILGHGARLGKGGGWGC